MIGLRLPETAAVILIDGKLYGYGETRVAAMLDFHHNTSGASRRWKNAMLSRTIMHAIDADHASEVAEMLAAPAIRWEGQS